MMITEDKLKQEVFYDNYFILENHGETCNFSVVKEGVELGTFVAIPYGNQFLFVENPRKDSDKNRDIYNYSLMEKETYENGMAETQKELDTVMERISSHKELNAYELNVLQERMNGLIQKLIVFKGKLKEIDDKIKTLSQIDKFDEFMTELLIRMNRISEENHEFEEEKEPSVESLTLLKSMSNKEGLTRLLSNVEETVSLKDIFKVMSGGILRPKETEKMENVFIKKVDEELDKILNDIYKQ